MTYEVIKTNTINFDIFVSRPDDPPMPNHVKYAHCLIYVNYVNQVTPPSCTSKSAC